MKETHLVRQILEYCQHKNLLFYRTQAGAIKTEKGNLVKMGMVGCPDLTGCFRGRYIALECKVGKNKQTLPQKNFQEWVENNGGEYWLIYSLDEFIETMDDLIKLTTT